MSIFFQPCVTYYQSMVSEAFGTEWDWVYAPLKFSKPLTIEVQHCSNFSNPNQLCFIRTSCTQKSLPYNFKIVDGGSFTLSSRYGILSTTHFSGNGIAKEVTPGEHSCRYCAQVYFTAKHLKDYWYCHFVITKDLEMCLAVSANNKWSTVRTNFNVSS